MRAICAFVIFSATLLHAEEKSKPLEFAVSAGSSLRIVLSAGDYEVSPAKDGKVHVTYRAADADHLRAVKVDFGNKRGAQLVIGGTPHSDFTASIEVPSRIDLDIRLSAGELNVHGGIEGSKTVQSHAGDVRVEVDDPKQYGSVDASVRIGDLDAGPFHAESGGLLRHVHETGPGKYKLDVHVGVGDLRLLTPKKEPAVK